MNRAGEWARRHWPFLVTTLVFVASRWVYRNLFFVRFDPSPLDFYIQYIDPWFMEHDFARSLLYLHNQGPLLNLLVGGALRLFDRPTAFVVLEALFTCLSFATVIGLLYVALGLGIRAGVACVMCSIYAASPTTVIYENWLFYHAPVAFCLVLSVAALIRYHHERTFAAALAFFTLLAVTALFRSTFGPLFLVGALLLLLTRPPLGDSHKAARRKLLAAAAAPFLILSLNSLKPWVLVGHGYGDTYLWGNLSAKVRDQLPEAERARLIARGAVSRAIEIFCFADLRDFGELRIPHAPTGVPLLDQERAPNGRWNAHALEYLLLTDAHFKPNALYLLSHYPEAYLKSVRLGLRAFAGSSLDDSTLPGNPNTKRLRAPSEALDRLFGAREDKSFGCLAWGLPLIFGYGLLRAARARVPSRRGSTTALAFVLIIVAYVTAVSVLISAGDYARYRFDVQPLFLLLFALSLSDLRLPRFLLARAWLR